MNERTHAMERPVFDRPWPLITATLISYVLAAVISVSMGRADDASARAAAGPTPYSADHARIPDARADEEQPPTF